MKAMKMILMTLIGCILMEGVVFSGGEHTLAPAGAPLPRSFEGAHLEMSYAEIRAAAQRVGRIDRTSARHQTITVRPKDHHLQSIVYRFHRNALREMTIAYQPDRIPGGYEALLGRLKEVYGQPVIEDQEEYDPRPDVFSMRKTVWTDEATMVVFSKSRRLDAEYDGQGLLLTITDRALQRAYEEERTQEYRQRVFNIPIPLSDAIANSTRTPFDELRRRD